MHLELRWRWKPQARRGLAARAGTALLLAVLLLQALPMTFAPAFAQAGAQAGYDSAEVQEARDRVLDSRYQTERPAPETPPDIDRFTLPPWLAKILYWAIIAGVVALVLFFLGNLAFDLLRNRDAFRRNREQPVEGPRRVDTPLRDHSPAEAGSLAEADRLAAEGRFGDAIHLLLLVALERLRQELGPRIAPAMTGREVLRLPALPNRALEPLSRIVQLSELKHFGGREAAQGDYISCRADFLRFSGEEPATA